ncbi:hypothetical protein [Mycoplasma capricolum]|uniref:hypothetical protein n=1 Tax=Mycoplasma capricolum TaxID=2095 RepID=UPI001FB8567B|nr:hypothetical protein [Mycoplasma capricolum]
MGFIKAKADSLPFLSLPTSISNNEKSKKLYFFLIASITKSFKFLPSSFITDTYAL